jgi:RNA polymerase sigma-70 factor (ECF subfamily)
MSAPERIGSLERQMTVDASTTGPRLLSTRLPDSSAAVPDEALAVIAALDSEHGPRLFGFARRVGLDTEQANDAVQEVFTRLLAELSRGVVVADPRSWTYRVLYRIAMDEHRFGRRLSDLRIRLTRQLSRQPERELSDSIAVWTEVGRLPRRQREVIHLRYRGDLPFDQVGLVLGITPSAARSHATQAMATLRRRLVDQEPR